MEVIELPGYIEDEKLHIARQLPGAARRSSEHGLRCRQLRFTDDGAAQDHPRVHPRGGRAQPGARDRHDLPQGGARSGGPAARRRPPAEAPAEPRAAEPPRQRRRAAPPASPTAAELAAPKPGKRLRRLIRAAHLERFSARRATPGAWPRSATRSAWRPAWPGRPSAATSMGIEVTLMEGRGQPLLTGQLGDVMKESAQAACQLCPLVGHAAGRGPAALREAGHPHPRARGRDPEGRPLGGRDDGDRADLGADPAARCAARWR